jgi:RNA polymerase sigma-70 factor (ECF subfamily)
VSRADLKTSAAMLEQMRDPNDNEAWARFFRRYEKIVRNWCHTCGLQEADAEDVTQKIMLILLHEMPEFVYDHAKGRFRDWLRMITRRACYRFLERDQSRKYRPILDDIQAREELDRSLEDQARIDVLHAAMEEVQTRVSPRDWRIFRELSFEDRSGDELAGELGMTVAAVFKAASRVRRRVIEQVREFGGSESDVHVANKPMPG